MKIIALVLALFAVGCGSSPLAPTNEQRILWVYNVTNPERNPNFRAGDVVRLAASPVAPLDDVWLCHIIEAPLGISSMCYPTAGGAAVIDARNNTWHLDFALSEQDRGIIWTSWIKVNGIESTRATFRVQ